MKSFLDISIENIMVPVEGTKLTGGLTYERRRGTLIDWNLCFTADGTASDEGEAKPKPKVSSKEVAEFRDHCVYIRSVHTLMMRIWTAGVRPFTRSRGRFVSIRRCSRQRPANHGGPILASIPWDRSRRPSLAHCAAV